LNQPKDSGILKKYLNKSTTLTIVSEFDSIKNFAPSDYKEGCDISDFEQCSQDPECMLEPIELKQQLDEAKEEAENENHQDL